MSGPARIGVDVGGTFTDIVVTRDGTTRHWQVGHHCL